MDGIGPLGEFVRRQREAMGLSLTALAARAELSKSEVSALENGRINLPTADKRRRLAAAIGIRHIDILVAAGELSPKEIASVAPKWPSTDEQKIRLWEWIAAMGSEWLPHAAIALWAFARAAGVAPPQPLESPR